MNVDFGLILSLLKFWAILKFFKRPIILFININCLQNGVKMSEIIMSTNKKYGNKSKALGQ